MISRFSLFVKMLRITVLIILGVFLISQTKAENFVINGMTAYPGQFPSALFLEFKKNSRIMRNGATLITYQYALTLANCAGVSDGFTFVPFKGLTLTAGAININNYAERRNVTKAIAHEKYGTNKSNYNIALLYFEEQFFWMKLIQPALIIPYPPDKEFGVTAVGWGITENGRRSDDLRFVYSEIATEEECKAEFPNDFTSICLKGKSRGTCYGDAGSGVYVKDTNYVVALTNFGKKNSQGKCDKNKLEGATYLWHFREWIREAVIKVEKIIKDEKSTDPEPEKIIKDEQSTDPE